MSSRDSMSSRSSDVVFLNSTVSVALVGALATNAGLGCCDGRVSPVGLARGQVWGVGLGRLDAKEVGRKLHIDLRSSRNFCCIQCIKDTKICTSHIQTRYPTDPTQDI